VPFVLKSRSLNLLEPSGPVQACNGIALPLHVSGINKCINATLGICHSVWMTVWCAGYQTVIHTEWKYQVSHWYSYFSWWWAHNCPKHVQNRNKHKGKIVRQVGFIYKTKGNTVFFRVWKNSNNWYTELSQLLCHFYSLYIIYECGRGPNNATWRLDTHDLDDILRESVCQFRFRYLFSKSCIFLWCVS